VPQRVRDKNWKCWNRGRIFISEQGPLRVADAYFSQFQEDFNAFLRAREKEMVVGSRMFVMGLIEEEKFDSFNIPYYGPSPEELKSEVQKEGSFTIVGFEVIIGVGNIDNIDDNGKEPNAKFLSKQIRTVLESIISNHFEECV
ncbi:hypothetical protein KI387_019498, partial [Taxus chinensis]